MEQLDLTTLGLVFTKLPDFEQAVTFGRVCKEWRGVARQQHSRPAEGRLRRAGGDNLLPSMSLRYFTEAWDNSNLLVSKRGETGQRRLERLARSLDWPRSIFGWGICHVLAEQGHLAALQWVQKLGHLDRSGSELCEMAARGGHLPVLQWLRHKRCGWGPDTCMAAARFGHLEVLQWARAHHCRWDASACAAAAAGGHLEVLQWARAQGCPWDRRTCIYAAERRWPCGSAAMGR